MSWRGLALVAIGWLVFCIAVASSPLEGAIVGAASVILIAGCRFALEWDARHDWPGRLRSRLGR